MLGYLYAYLLGGFTFVPLAVILFLLYVRIYASTPIGDADPDKERKKETELAFETGEEKEKDSVDERKLILQPSTASKHLTGWMTVRRTFEPPGTQPAANGAQKSTPLTEGTGTDTSKVDFTSDDNEKEGSSTAATTSGKYSTMLLNSYRSIVEHRSASPAAGSTPSQAQSVGLSSTAPSNPPKEFLFCALKGSVLFMYEDEDQNDCVGVIGIDGFTVGISRGDEECPELAVDGALAVKGKTKMLDGELFAKRHAIVLRQIPQHSERKKAGRKGTRPRSNTAMNALLKGMDDGAQLPSLTSSSATAGQVGEDETSKRRRERKERQRERERVEAQPWYFFAKNNVKMEQWYHALLSQASPPPPISNETPRLGLTTFGKVFSPDDMQNLIDTLNNESDPIPIRWANAMLGRIFLGLCRTAALEAFIIGKMMKKIKKIKTPSFLGDIVVNEVDVGTSPPFFSKPMLKELTPEGDASFEVEVHYKGDFKIRIATTAIIPTGFSKPYKINLELLATLKGLHGNMIFQIKKPPSNRIWYSFTKMPEIELRVEPVVSDRKIQLGMVIKAIEKQIRDAIADSVVMPNMDDLAFFDTQHLRIRGGIFDEAGKHEGVHLAGNITGDGLEHIPLADTKPVHSEESDGAVQTGLRHRKAKPSAAQPTMSTDALDLPDGSQAMEIKPVVRAETAPGAGQNRAFGSSLEATKKWFAHKGTASGEFAQISESKALGSDSPDGDSGERERPDAKPRIEATGNGFVLGASEPTKVVNTTVEAATVPSNTGGPSSVLDRTDDDDVPLARLSRSSSVSQSQVESLRSSHQSSPSLDMARNASTSRPQTPSAPSIAPEPVVPGQTASQLIGSLRSRTADKKALQASVNQARDAMKTWGNRWAAKRRSTAGEATALEESDALVESKLQEVGQQIVETGDHQSGHQRGQSVEGNKIVKPIDIARPSGSLQDRLAAAAAAAAGSRSVGSDRTALARSAMAEEPEASDAGQTPQTERKASNASSISTASAPAHVISGSFSPPGEGINGAQQAIRRQPTGQSSMVVPRVPKRPDTVTSMSSTSAVHASANPQPPVESSPVTPPAAPQPPPLPKRSVSTTHAQATDVLEPVANTPELQRPSSAEADLENKSAAVSPAETKVSDAAPNASTPVPAAPAPTYTGAAAAPALPPRKTVIRTPSLRHLPDDVPGNKTEDVFVGSLAKGAPSTSITAKDALKKMVAMDEMSRTAPGSPDVS